MNNRTAHEPVIVGRRPNDGPWVLAVVPRRGPGGQPRLIDFEWRPSRVPTVREAVREILTQNAGGVS